MRIIIASIAFLFAASGPVFAHAHLDRASPAVGSTVTPAPKEVVLWFTNQLEPAFSSIEVRDEKGASVQAGKAVVDRRNRARMSVPLQAFPAGSYNGRWRGVPQGAHRAPGPFFVWSRPRRRRGPPLACARVCIAWGLLASVRAVHFGTTLAAGGPIGFVYLVAEPAKVPADFQPLRSRLSVLILLVLVVAILSGAVWLVLLAADILGAPLLEVCLHGRA